MSRVGGEGSNVSPHPAIRRLQVSILTADAFRPFGEVITLGRDEGTDPAQAHLFQGVAQIDLGGGQANLDTLYAVPHLPRVEWMERHPNSSQAFLPLAPARMLVAVALPAPEEGPIDAGRVRAFVTDGYQGVNFAPRVWHHPVIPVAAPLMLAVIHRGPSGGMTSEIAKIGPDAAVDLVVDD